MIVIGIDPHTSTHTATTLDAATSTDMGSVRIDTSIAEYKTACHVGESMA